MEVEKHEKNSYVDDESIVMTPGTELCLREDVERLYQHMR